MRVVRACACGGSTSVEAVEAGEDCGMSCCVDVLLELPIGPVEEISLAMPQAMLACGDDRVLKNCLTAAG